MNFFLAGLIVLVAVALAVTAMLTLRARLPGGRIIQDIDRSAAVLGFVATAFSLLMAFVIFLALETYTGAKNDAAAEADSVLEQFEIAALLSPADRDVVQSQLVCYARSVINDEWSLMRGGKHSDLVEGWILKIETSINAANVSTPKQETGIDKFFDETLERAKGRRGRMAEGDGVIPPPLWSLMLFASVCLVGLVLLLASSAESAVVQVIQAGAVTALVVLSLLLVDFLDHPFRNSSGSIRPDSMARSLAEMQREFKGPTVCNATGQPG